MKKAKNTRHKNPFHANRICATAFLTMLAPSALSAPLEFEEIGAGVYAHIGEIAIPNEENQGDASNLGIIIGDDAVMVVDSGGSAVVGERILETVKTLTDLPIKYLVITHVHPDHIYGAKTLTDQGIALIGHANLPEAIAARQDIYAQNYAQTVGPAAIQNSEIPSVNTIVDAPLEIDLGNRPIRLSPQSIAHTNNDVTVFDVQTGSLFLGDILFDNHVPVIDGSLRGWQDVMAQMDLTGVQNVIPGHGDIIKTETIKNEITPATIWTKQSDYFDVLASDAKTAIDSGEFMSDAIKTIGQSQRENWSLFDDYNARNASVVYSELEWE